MAFRFGLVIEDAEFRGLSSGLGKNDRTWMSLRIEYQGLGGEVETTEVSVPSEMQADVYAMGLKKGQMMNLPVVVAAGRRRDGSSYDYIQLTALPMADDPDF